MTAPLASTRDGRTTVSPALAGRPDRSWVLAHEAAHVVQFSGRALGLPTGSRDDLERDAQDGAARLAVGLPAVPRFAAPQGMTLHYDPPEVFAATAGTRTDTDAGQPSAGTATLPDVEPNVVRIPPEETDLPGRRDILVLMAGDRLVALPAQGSVVFLRAPAAPASAAGGAPTPLVSVPTIAKEGLRVVNVGSGTGVVLDAGGRPAVVFSGPLAQSMDALGVRSLRSVVVMHLHQDHVTSLAELIRTHGIAPENVHYPEAFEVNPAAPGSDFARQMQEVRGRVGAGAAFRTIPTPTRGAYFHTQLIEGEVRLDLYGISAAFQQLAAQRRAGQKQSVADQASLLVRATHEPTGTAVLFLGDLRGEDLTAFRQAMGPRFDEVLRGVRVISGFQHHIGALESANDASGLRALIEQTFLRTGSLSVVIQTQEARQNRQFLNRSLISGLNAMGVDVHLAMDPAGGAGAVTVHTDNTVTHTGGSTESHLGSATVRRHVQRLAELEAAMETMYRFGRHVPQSDAFARELEQSRTRLRAALSNYVELVLGGVRTGSAGRAQQSLNNPQQIRAAERALETLQYRILMPAELTDLRELNRIGPHLEVLEREMRQARQSGRLSDAGIEALWEVSPAEARRLIQSSRLPRSERSRVLQHLPGQPMPVRGRLVAGALLALQVFNEVAPLIQTEQARAHQDNVSRFLADILFWQGAGVIPQVQAVQDRWWPRDNLWTTDPRTISGWLSDGDVDYLALTGIEDRQWDAFTIWAQTAITNYGDWQILIADNAALRASGDSITELRWSYRTGHITGTTFGHDLDVEWVDSERLTRILQATARAMVEQSRSEIRSVATGPGPVTQTSVSASGSHQHHTIYADMPQAIRTVRYRAKVVEPTVYTYREQHSRTGMDRGAVFHVFPATAYPHDAPEGYLLVGGADYNTYVTIAGAPNIVDRSGLDEFGRVYSYTARGRSPLMWVRAVDVEDVR